MTDDPRRAGAVYALVAFLIWGLFPLYFRWLSAVPAMEVLAHRIAWSALLLAGLALWRGQGRTLLGEIRRPKRLAFYGVTTLLISANWGVFIWASQNGRVLEASLGYFINPLVSVALGMLFLSERLNRMQAAAVAIAVAGVSWMVFAMGSLPWVSLILAVSFGAYALVRKKAGFDAMTGLTVETLLLAPIALAALLFWSAQGTAHIGRHGLDIDLMLLAAGLVTIVPLVCFLEAGLRLKLATVGLLQYLTPTLHFLLAVLFFGEAFDADRGIAFACIWLALILYSVDAYRSRRMRPVAPEAE